MIAKRIFDYFVENLENDVAFIKRETGSKICLLKEEDDEISNPPSNSSVYNWQNDLLSRDERRNYSCQDLALEFKKHPFSTTIKRGKYAGWTVSTDYRYEPISICNDEWMFEAEIWLTE